MKDLLKESLEKQLMPGLFVIEAFDQILGVFAEEPPDGLNIAAAL